MKNKRGSIMVEACIVFPIIILFSMATIYFSIFQYENLNLQIRQHGELLKDAQKAKNNVLYIKEKKVSNCISLGGITENILKKDIYASKYIVNYPKAAKVKNVIIN